MGIGEIIALCGLALNVMVAAVGLTWGIGKIRDTVRGEIETHRTKFDGELVIYRDKFGGELDLIERRYGETIAAMRRKIADVELYAANNYVRRDGFYKVQEQLTAEFRALRDSIDGRFQRIEEQISHLRSQ